MTLKVQRYLTRYLGSHAGSEVYAAGCVFRRPGDEPRPPTRTLARFLGMDALGTPIYGYSACEFPRIGRYLVRYLGIDGDSPVYALACCAEPGSSGSSASSGYSGSSGESGSSGGSSGPSGSSGGSGSSGESGSGSGSGSESGSSGTSGSSGESGSSGSSGESGSSGSSGIGSSSGPIGFDCSCCLPGERLGGFLMTVSGITNHSPNCDCAGLNATAFVPVVDHSPGHCSGFTEAGVVTCSPGGSRPGRFAWDVSCDGSSIYLIATFGPTEGEGEGIVIERSFPQSGGCSQLLASGNDVPSPPSLFDFCDYTGATLSIVPVLV